MKILKPMLLVTTLTALTACTGSKKEQDKSISTHNVSGIVSNAQINNSTKADKLAAIAEQLFTLTNFMHSVELADMALTLDPSNTKAQFYKIAAAPMMNLKGLVKRVQPQLDLVQKAELQKQIDNFPDSALKTFLLDGSEDMKSEKDMQAFIDQYINAMNDMRVFLKNNKNLEVTLNANDWSWPAYLERAKQECELEYTFDGQIDEIQCPMKSAGEIKMNAADMEALQHMHGGLQLYLSMLNSYDFTGVQALSKLPEDQRNKMSKSETFQFLSKYKDFGVYRSSSQLNKIPEMGLDFVQAAKWAYQMQHILCKKGFESAKNRPGFLFNKGLCLDVDDPQKFSKDLALVELVLNGGLLPILDDEGAETGIALKPVLLFSNPIGDIKDLKPTFEKCENDKFIENITSVSDTTLNGIFPGGELNSLLRSSHDSQCAESVNY